MCAAEIMTVGVVAALFHGGNIAAARRFLKLCNYIPNMLGHSRLHRRLMAIPIEIWEAIFTILKETLNALFPTTTFAVDSCPLLACQPCRSWRCKLYHGKQYLGYCAAKNQHPGYLRFLQSSGRKVVETVFSQIARIMPRAFVVRTAKGLHLRIMLMLLAYTVDRFIPNLAP